MKSEKKKILSGKECEVMNYLPYFKEPPIDVIKRYKTIKRYALIFVKQLLLNTFSVKTIDNLKKSCYNKTTTKARPQNGQP